MNNTGILFSNCPRLLYNHQLTQFLYTHSGTNILYLDRFNQFPRKHNKQFQYISDPYPQIISDTFEQLCLQRAQYLAKQNKPILILSSGGIDSLVVIASFIRINCSDKIRIICLRTGETDDELFAYLKNKQIKCDIFNNPSDIQNIDINQYIITDGQCGDQLTNLTVHYKISERQHLDINADLNELMHNQDFKQWLNTSPVKLDNQEKILWYIKFCFKWRQCQYIQIPHLIYTITGKRINYNDYYPFFATNEFSNYAISNLDIIINEQNYKQYFKDFIITAFNDNNIKNKILHINKTYSIEKVYPRKRTVHIKNTDIYNIILSNNKIHTTQLLKKLYIYSASTPLKNSTLKNMSIVAHMPITFIDRFGILNKQRSIQYDRLPQPISTTFKALCINRAKDILNLAQNKKIIIMSSGGIDSLTVISSFILINAQNKIEICEFKSNETNMDIINYYRSIGIIYTVYDKFDPHILDKKIIIDGNCGDQLNHSISFFDNNVSYDDDVNMIQRMAEQEQAYQKLKTDKYFQYWISKSPITLNTDDEIKWYISYACKWRTVQYQHLPGLIEKIYNYQININNYYAFFGTDDFSDWAFTHFKENLQLDQSQNINYKINFKNVILETIHNNALRTFITNKGKSLSLGHDLFSIKTKKTLIKQDCIYSTTKHKSSFLLENKTIVTSR